MRHLLVLVFFVLLIPDIVLAQGDEEGISRARECVRNGETLYNQERFEEAAEQFKQAWRFVGEPAGMIYLDATAFLFNIGLCYDRAGRLSEAITYYQLYLEKSRQYAIQIDSDEERAILDRVNQFRQQLAANAEISVPPALPADHVEIFELITTVDTLDRRVTQLEDLVLQDKSLFFDIIRPSYIFWGAGVVSFIVGGVYGGLALDAESTMRSQQTQIEAWPYKEEAEEDALIANVFYGIGAAALIGGTIWFFFDLFDDDDELESQGPTIKTAFVSSFTSESFGLTLSVNL